jgi:hypothetical protein
MGFKYFGLRVSQINLFASTTISNIIIYVIDKFRFEKFNYSRGIVTDKTVLMLNHRLICQSFEGRSRRYSKR